VGEHVPYEVAQQSISAVRISGDSLNPTPEELKVVLVKTVCSIQTKCDIDDFIVLT
jgi:hypothetical protein